MGVFNLKSKGADVTEKRKLNIKDLVVQESFNFVLSTIFSTAIIIIKEIAKLMVTLDNASFGSVVKILFSNLGIQTAYIIIENICLAIMIWGMIVVCENMGRINKKQDNRYKPAKLFYILFALYIIFCVACVTMGIFQPDVTLLLCMGFFALLMAVLLVLFFYKSNQQSNKTYTSDDGGCISAR